MFSEVPFHTQEQCATFRDFVISHSEPATRVFSGGSSFGAAFSFANIINSDVGKRFIVWRVQDNKLELIDTCLEQELQHNSIRIYFPHHIIPTVSIAEYTASSNNYVCVLVLTAGRILYRFIFPHPITLLRNGATRNHSIFENTSARDIDAPNTLVTLSLRRAAAEPPKVCSASSPTHFGIACGAQIFLVRLSDPSVTHFSGRPGRLEATETEYPEHGLIASYLPLMRRSQPPILALALLDNFTDSDDPIVFGLSASKLHIYSRRINYSITLATDTIAEGELVDAGKLRLSADLREEGMSVRVVVARIRNGGDDIEVLTFVGVHERAGVLSLDQNSCQLLDNNSMIDLAIGVPDKDFTWVLGRNADDEFTVHNSVTQSTDEDTQPIEEDFEQVTMSKKKTRSWTKYSLLQKGQHLPDVEPNTIDVDSFYWGILHRHGQFDRQTIANALTLLDPPRDKELRAPLHKYPASRLEAAAIAIVRKVIEEESGEEAVVDPVRHAANVWGRVWAYCVKQWEAANTPIGLHVNMETGLYLIIRQHSVGLFRRRFPIEMVAWTEDDEGSEEHSEAHFLQDEDVDNLWTCCSYVLVEMGPALIRFDCDLSLNETEIHQLGAQYTENMIGSQTEEQSLVATNFIRYFYVIKDPVAASLRLMEIINEQSTDESVKLAFSNASATASAAGGVLELADARYRVSTGLFLVLSIVSRLRTSLHTPPPALAQLTTRVYDAAARLVRLYASMSWLVTQPYDRPNARWASMENQFVNLSLGQGANGTLAEAYVRSSAFTMREDELHDASYMVSQIALQVCTSLDVNTVSTQPFMNFLVQNEQWSALEKLVHRLEGIQPAPFEHSSGRGVVLETQLLQDLKGRALLNMGKYDTASDVLANVASYIAEDEAIAVRVIGEKDINDGLASLPSQRGQELCPVALKWFYCLKIAEMFALHRQFQHAERFYTVALPSIDDPNAHRSPDHVRNEVTAVAWSSIFESRLKCEPPQFEQAYQALTAYPDFPRSDRSQDALRHLVTQLCDSGKEGVAALHKLPFVGKGVVSTVISHILNKARLADLPYDLANPLNYYTVLYSFLITRENHREAAKCMYEYAHRIPLSYQSRDSSSSSPSSHFSPSQDKSRTPQNPFIFQAQALLVAINSLKIVDTNYQWITVEMQDKAQATKRKRTDNAISTISTPVTLDEIEKAYTLADAHAYLWTATKNPKGLLVRGSGPNARDTFSLLTVTDNYQMSFDFAKTFSLDPKPVLENLVEKCGKDPQFAVSTGWNALKRWLDANDVVSNSKDISPSGMREIINERNLNARNGVVQDDADASAGSQVYHLVGNYVEKLEVREPNVDARYFVRLGDTRGTVDVCVTAPLPSSVQFGQPVHVFAKLVPEGKIDANRMDDSPARAQETLHAVRVVPLRQNAAHAYHDLVADKLLATNPRIVLPVWLVRWFSESTSCYPDLLRIYLSHNRLEDATFVAMDMLSTATQQLKHARTPTQVFLPYTLLDNLFSSLEEGPSKTRLSSDLRAYFASLDQPAR